VSLPRGRGRTGPYVRPRRSAGQPWDEHVERDTGTRARLNAKISRVALAAFSQLSRNAPRASPQSPTDGTPDPILQQRLIAETLTLDDQLLAAPRSGAAHATPPIRRSPSPPARRLGATDHAFRVARQVHDRSRELTSSLRSAGIAALVQRALQCAASRTPPTRDPAWCQAATGAPTRLESRRQIHAGALPNARSSYATGHVCDRPMILWPPRGLSR
jgi:hypothetical protein